MSNVKVFKTLVVLYLHMFSWTFRASDSKTDPSKYRKWLGTSFVCLFFV